MMIKCFMLVNIRNIFNFANTHEISPMLDKLKIVSQDTAILLIIIAFIFIIYNNNHYSTTTTTTTTTTITTDNNYNDICNSKNCYYYRYKSIMIIKNINNSER